MTDFRKVMAQRYGGAEQPVNSENNQSAVSTVDFREKMRQKYGGTTGHSSQSAANLELILPQLSTANTQAATGLDVTKLQEEHRALKEKLQLAEMSQISLSGADRAEADEYKAKVQQQYDEATERLRAIDPNLVDPTLKERIGKVFKGTGQTAGGNYLSALATLGLTNEDAYTMISSPFEDQTAMIENIREDYTKMAQRADELSAKGAENLARAKQGAGAVGEFAVDLGSAGLMMGADALLGLVSPALATASMGSRSFGGAAQEARAEGADLNEQFSYAASTAAKDILLNKLLGGLGRVYGNSKVGKAVTNMVDSRISNPQTRRMLTAALNAALEGGEEALESVAGNALKSIYNDKGALENVTDAELGDYLYEALIGAALGGATELIGSGIDRAARPAESARTEQSIEPAAPTPAPAPAIPTPTPVQPSPSEYTETVLNILRGDVSNRKAESIYNNPQLKTAFEALGLGELNGTNSQNRATVKQASQSIKNSSEGMGDINTPPDTAEATTGVSGALNSNGTTNAPNTEPTPFEIVMGLTPENKKGGVTQVPNAQRPGNTPNASLASSPQPETIVSNDSITQVGEKGKQKATPPTASEVAKRIPADDGTSLYDAQVAAYGAINPGERPARNVEVPRSVGEGSKVSQTARTVMEAAATPDARLSTIEDAIVDGKLSYVPTTNAQLEAKATEIVRRDGWATALNNWTAAVRGGKASNELVAVGAVLLNNIGNSDATAKQYVDLLMDYQDLTTRLGKGLAATRMLKRLSPEGRLYAIQRSIRSLTDELKGKYKVDIDESLIDEYRRQTTDEGRDEVISKIQRNIADQLPATFIEKANALRYLNMLGNVKTQVRNLAGNAASTLGRAASDRLAAALEAVFVKPEDRNKSAWAGTELYKQAWEDWADNKDLAMGENKYSDPEKKFSREIQDRRQIFGFEIFGFKPLEAYRKATNWAMEQGDAFFSRLNYADIMAGYLAAHKVKNMADAPPELLDRAREYAAKRAQEATFRDENAATRRVEKMTKPFGVVGQAVLPFKKTPTNVLVRAEEYSPLGIINTAYKAIQMKKGNVSGSDVVESLAKSLSGTGLFVLGYMLANSGALHAPTDDDELQDFREMQGVQPWSLNLPSGGTVTLDWLSPYAIPMFMGAALSEASADNGIAADEIISVLGSITAPMLEMTMLQGVNDAISNVVEYGGDIAATPQFLINAMASFAQQLFGNSLLRQAEQASDKYRQTTYTDKDSFLPSGVQYAASKLLNSIPGVDYHQQDYIDAWGRKQEQGNWFERNFNAFINPAYVSKDRSTEVDAELERLYQYGKDIDDFPNVLPQKGSRTMDLGNGETMTPEEYEKYSISRGEQSLELVQDFMASKQYEGLTDEQRAEVISNLYSFAADRAKKEIQQAHGIKYKGDWDDEAKLHDLPEYLAAKSRFSTATSDVENRDYSAIDELVKDWSGFKPTTRTQLANTTSVLDDLVAARKAGVDSEAWYTAKDAINDYKKGNGNSITGVAALRVILGEDFTPREEAYLVSDMTDSKEVERTYNAFTNAGYPGFDALSFLLADGSNSDGTMSKPEEKSYIKKNYGSRFDEIWAILYPKG